MPQQLDRSVQPRVVTHCLVTVDGRIEGFSPQGIGLYYQLADKLECDTWLVGSDTLLAAESLPDTQIHPADRAAEPLPAVASTGGALMAVPDSRGRVRNYCTHLQGVGARGLVVLVSTATSREYLDYLAKRNVPCIEAGDDHVDYRAAFAELHARYGTHAIRTDSGGVLNNKLLEQGLVAELSLLISPELAGKGQRGLFRTLEIPSAMRLDLVSSDQVGEGLVWLRYRVRR